MNAPTLWQRLATLSVAALVVTTTHAQDTAPELDQSITESSELAAPLGLMTPAAPTIDSIDGTGLRRVSDPGTDSIDGTGLEQTGSSGTESIDGTGFLHSTPADNLAQSGQPLRTIDAEHGAQSGCDESAAMAASDSCDPEAATTE